MLSIGADIITNTIVGVPYYYGQHCSPATAAARVIHL